MKAKSTCVPGVVPLLVFLFIAVSCGYKLPTMRTAAIPNLPQDVRLDLPHDLRNSDTDSGLQKASAVIVSITADQQFYVGHDLTPKDRIGDKIGELLKQPGELVKPARQSDPEKIVYIAAGVGVDYQAVVHVLGLIRRQDVDTVGLIAGRKATDQAAPQASDERSRFLVTMPAEPDPNEDLRTLKPNPLTLVVSLSGARRYSLNGRESPEQGEPCFGLAPTYGSVNDSEPLAKCLVLLFQKRKENHAYKPGAETRSDLTEDERVEKTILIKAPRSIKYGEVIRTIDAVKGAGASPIGLQIDDLPQ